MTKIIKYEKEYFFLASGEIPTIKESYIKNGKIQIIGVGELKGFQRVWYAEWKCPDTFDHIGWNEQLGLLVKRRGYSIRSFVVRLTSEKDSTFKWAKWYNEEMYPHVYDELPFHWQTVKVRLLKENRYIDAKMKVPYWDETDTKGDILAFYKSMIKEEIENPDEYIDPKRENLKAYRYYVKALQHGYKDTMPSAVKNILCPSLKKLKGFSNER